MDSGMAAHVAKDTEAAATTVDRAHEGFLSCMAVEMDLETTGTTEAFAAVAALVLCRATHGS